MVFKLTETSKKSGYSGRGLLWVAAIEHPRALAVQGRRREIGATYQGAATLLETTGAEYYVFGLLCKTSCSDVPYDSVCDE